MTDTITVSTINDDFIHCSISAKGVGSYIIARARKIKILPMMSRLRSDFAQFHNAEQEVFEIPFKRGENDFLDWLAATIMDESAWSYVPVASNNYTRDHILDNVCNATSFGDSVIVEFEDFLPCEHDDTIPSLEEQFGEELAPRIEMISRLAQAKGLTGIVFY